MNSENKHGNIGNRNAAKTEKADTFIHARCKPADKARWVKAAQKRGMKLTQWIVGTLNDSS